VEKEESWTPKALGVHPGATIGWSQPRGETWTELRRPTSRSLGAMSRDPSGWD